MKTAALKKPLQNYSYSYDVEFFDDALDFFMDMGDGRLEKYMYNSTFWDDIVKQSSDYYIPKADKELSQKALDYIVNYLPPRTSCVDFGVGSPEAIKRNSLPMARALRSKKYYAIDFSQKFLEDAISLQSEFGSTCKVITKQMDFFIQSNTIISDGPAIGILTGSTIGNNYGSLSDRHININLSRTLRHLLRLVNNGWLMLSFDTNQNEAELVRAYQTPLNSRLHLSVLPRMSEELPMDNFDPSLFAYQPEWHSECQVVAHMIVATENQDFTLGNYSLSVKKGQRMHMFNSYKFNRDFFETCCKDANISIVKKWDHETPMKLYILGRPE
jgi:uncharacterized SAM-dependent methyltransferase